MKNKVYMYINEDEKSIVVSSLIDLKNETEQAAAERLLYICASV